MKNSLEIIDNSIRNYTEKNGKHLLFKIAERNETFKIHSFEEKERINFENDSKFIMPVFNYTTNCIDNGNLILNASLNVFTKPKYEDKECTKLIPTFKLNEIIDLVTLKNVYKNNWILKPIIIDCFIKIVQPYENGHLCTEIVQSKQLIFEIFN